MWPSTGYAARLTVVSCAVGSESTRLVEDQQGNRRNWREIVVQHKIPGSKNEDLVGEKKRIGEIETSRRNGNRNSGEAGRGKAASATSREDMRTLGQWVSEDLGG